jgi:hypothetical protein
MDSQSCPEPVLPVIKEIDDDCDHYDWVAKFSVSYLRTLSLISLFGFKKLPQSVQNDALADLITMCTYSQIRHLQFVIAPYFQKDFINLLPKEVCYDNFVSIVLVHHCFYSFHCAFSVIFPQRISFKPLRSPVIGEKYQKMSYCGLKSADDMKLEKYSLRRIADF